MRSMTLTEKTTPEQTPTTYTLEEARVLFEEEQKQAQAEQAEATRMCGEELAELLKRYKRNMVPQLVIQGTTIVSHDIILVPVGQ